MRKMLAIGIVAALTVTAPLVASAKEIGAHGESLTLLEQRHIANNYSRFRKLYAENLSKEDAAKKWKLLRKGKLKEAEAIQPNH